MMNSLTKIQTFDTDLLDAIQEHIDAHDLGYDKGIDWANAIISAHAALDKYVGHNEVKRHLARFMD